MNNGGESGGKSTWELLQWCRGEMGADWVNVVMTVDFGRRFGSREKLHMTIKERVDLVSTRVKGTL